MSVSLIISAHGITYATWLVVGENTVLQLNILETGSHTRGSEFIFNS